jgi:hypothetical protein
VKAFLFKNRLLPALWGILAAVILGIDFITGPDIAFPYFFLVPVVLAARYSGALWGYSLAVLLPVIRFFFHFAWLGQTSLFNDFFNVAIRMIILAAAAYLVDRITRQAREIQILRGSLPICSICKRIRDANQNWTSVETYITKHSEAEFSHTLCPECSKRHYGAWLEQKDSSPAN